MKKICPYCGRTGELGTNCQGCGYVYRKSDEDTKDTKGFHFSMNGFDFTMPEGIFKNLNNFEEFRDYSDIEDFEGLKESFKDFDKFKEELQMLIKKAEETKAAQKSQETPKPQEAPKPQRTPKPQDTPKPQRTQKPQGTQTSQKANADHVTRVSIPQEPKPPLPPTAMLRKNFIPFLLACALAFNGTGAFINTMRRIPVANAVTTLVDMIICTMLISGGLWGCLGALGFHSKQPIYRIIRLVFVCCCTVTVIIGIQSLLKAL